MQHGGNFKKRSRRNLTKVNGLYQQPFQINDGDFLGLKHVVQQGDNEINGKHSKVFSVHTGMDTRLRLNSSEMMEYRRECAATPSSRQRGIRVTRNPKFHLEMEGNDDQMEEGVNVETDLSGNQGTGKDEHLPKRKLIQREYFLDKDIIQRLKHLIWLGVASGLFPWKWNEKEHKVEKWGAFMEKLWWIQWIFVTIQTVAIGGFQFYTFVHAVSAAKSYRGAFQSSFIFLWYFYAILINVQVYFYGESMRAYINTLMRFNHNYVQKYLIHLDGYKDGGGWIINIAVVPLVIQIFLSANFFLTMPFQPWYLFSYIYPKPWYWLIPGAVQDFMMTGQAISGYLFFCWIFVAHTNTLNFWLRETHNHNDSDYTFDELRSQKTAVETYRAIQVLGKLFNNCIAPIGTPFLKITLATTIIPCGYVLIRSMNHLFFDEFPSSLMYPLGLFNCAVPGFVLLRMSAEVFDLGFGFVDSWSRTKDKGFRRVLISCESLKIWVGRFYFLTLTTTITFFKVVFDFITNCIIAFP